MCRLRVACMRNARETRVVSFSKSYAVRTLINVAKETEEEEEGRREKEDLSSTFSLILVLKIILIVFSANDALVSKIMNKRKEINSFRSFNLRDVSRSAQRRRLRTKKTKSSGGGDAPSSSSSPSSLLSNGP